MNFSFQKKKKKKIFLEGADAEKFWKLLGGKGPIASEEV